MAASSPKQREDNNSYLLPCRDGTAATVQLVRSQFFPLVDS